MNNLLLIVFILSVMLNVVLLSLIKMGASAMKDATMLLKVANQSVAYWKLLAQRFESLLFAEEITKAIFNGIDVTAEHPDPAEQAQANKMITNLKRLAEKIKLADGLKTKGSDETN